MLIAILLAPAWAHQSDPEDLWIDSEVPLFSNVELDTGWQPKDGLLAVRFQVEADGGAEVVMDGTGTLSWPEDLNLLISPVAASGAVEVLASLGVLVSLKFDIDIYSWESEIANESVTVAGEREFEPFLLDGSIEDEVVFTSVGDEETIFSYSYDVLSGVASVGFYATFQPRNDTTFSGIGWLVEDQMATVADTPIVLPAEGQAAIDTEATFLSSWANDLDLVFVPTFQVCIIGLECYDWDITELSLDLATEAFEHAFPSVPLYFPLPVLDADDSLRDFGEVEVGTIANAEIPLNNLGEWYLEGTARIEGSSAFSVYPDTFLANDGASDGVMVTFAPSEVGVEEATLVVESNDPTAPTMLIVLRGDGFDDALSAGDGGGNEQTEVVKSGCGCATTTPRGALSGGVALMGLFGAVMRRRRVR